MFLLGTVWPYMGPCGPGIPSLVAIIADFWDVALATKLFESIKRRGASTDSKIVSPVVLASLQKSVDKW